MASLSCLQAPSPFEHELNCGLSIETLLQNFEQQWVTIFGMPWSSLPMSLIHSHAHVRLSVLALSACHLRHHLPDTTIACRTEQICQAAALHAYQDALNVPFDDLGQDGTDALLVTAMIFNTLSFVLPSHEDEADCNMPDISRSWVFSPREDRLGWIGIEMGLKPLLKATSQYRDGSALGPIFDAADNEERTLTSNGLSLSKVPTTWLNVFGLLEVNSQGTIDPQASVFREPLRIIAEIRHLRPTLVNMLRYVQFIGKLTSEFRDLLFNRDSRALWLFGFWLGLMCRFENLWWLNRRPRRDFKAVCQWLKEVGLAEQPGIKGVLWREMIRDSEQANRLPR